MSSSGVTPMEGVREVVTEYAREADRERRLSAKAVQALTDAGFARHFVPRRFGGRAGTFTEFVDDVAVVAEGCTSAGWCASLFASHARIAAFLPPAGQEELWGDGPDARISAGVIPSGTVRPAPGGWSLSGSWGYISGIDFADWVLVTGWEPEPEAEGRRLRFFAVPKEDCAVEDTWFTVGMRGTGSRTVVLDHVVVPEHRSFPQAALLAGEPPVTEGTAARCHTVPFRMVNGLSMVVPALGAARGALRHWSGWIARKGEVAMGRTVRAQDRASVRAALMRSSSAIDAAELLLRRIAGIADSSAPVDAGMVARSHRDYAVVAESLTDALNRLLRVSGARAQSEDDPLQRVWRDVNAATSHAALQFDSNSAVYAAYVFGDGAK